MRETPERRFQIPAGVASASEDADNDLMISQGSLEFKRAARAIGRFSL